MVAAASIRQRYAAACAACCLALPTSGRGADLKPRLLARIPAPAACGIVGGNPDECGTVLESNCTSAAGLPKLCPAACPYVVRHEELTCSFRCAAAADCFKLNPTRAFPNEETSACEPCGVVGCKRCSGPNTCAECLPHFVPVSHGQGCAYSIEFHMRSRIKMVFGMLGDVMLFGVLATLVVLAILRGVADWCGWLPSEHDDVARTDAEDEAGLLETLPTRRSSRALVSSALAQAMCHRHRCKITELRFTGTKQPDKKKVPFWANLQERFLAGVGLVLYHSWFPFIAVYGLLMAVGSYWVFQGAELSALVNAAGLDYASHLVLDAALDRGDSGMDHCAGHVGSDPVRVGRALRAYAHRASVGFAILWVLGLAMALLHAARQRHIAASFRAKHPCLADFALAVKGFPTDAIDEAEIADFFRRELGIQRLDVSISYTYRPHRWRMYDLLEKVLVAADVAAGTYCEDLVGSDHVGLTQQDRDEVSSWLDPSNPMRIGNAGVVFLVFPGVEDVELAMRQLRERMRSNGLGCSWPWRTAPIDPVEWVGRDGSRHPLVASEVVHEPTDIIWDYIDVHWSELLLRRVLGLAGIILSVAGVFSLVFLPFAAYALEHYSETGRQPSDWVMSLSGVVVMAANWVMCFVLWLIASHIGFKRKNVQDYWVFTAFALICGANFLFNLVTMIFPDGFGRMLSPLDFEGSVRMENVSAEVQASLKFFSLLVPGGLFIGYTMWPLQGFVWPLVSSFCCVRWRNLQKCHRDSLTNVIELFGGKVLRRLDSGAQRASHDECARETELAFEPLGISLAHDYMGHIVQPTCCTMALFFASGVVWQVFVFLALWGLFMIPFQRYMHLRACKKSFFTTEHLDALVVRSWGVPLSTILAASSYWAARLHGWSILRVVPGAFAAGYVVYLLFLRLCIGRRCSAAQSSAHAGEKVSVEEVAAKRLYNWHTCNPMRVLISNCSDSVGPPLVPFEIGKEYLQVQQQEEWLHQIQRMSSSVVSHRLKTTGSQDFVPEIESFVVGPYQRAAKAFEWMESTSGRWRETAEVCADRPSRDVPQAAGSGESRAAHGAADDCAHTQAVEGEGAAGADGDGRSGGAADDPTRPLLVARAGGA